LAKRGERWSLVFCRNFCAKYKREEKNRSVWQSSGYMQPMSFWSKRRAITWALKRKLGGLRKAGRICSDKGGRGTPILYVSPFRKTQ